VVCEYKFVLQVKIFALSLASWRVAIKFCVKAGKRAVGTIELINKAYGSTAMSCGNVYRWYARFRDEREDVRTMPKAVILRLPEQTKTWNLSVLC